MASDSLDYETIHNFLHRHKYPEVFTKNQKRAFRRTCTSYKVDRRQLFYFHKGCSSWKQVPKGRDEKVLILEACHASPEGMFSSTA